MWVEVRGLRVDLGYVAGCEWVGVAALGYCLKGHICLMSKYEIGRKSTNSMK
jgi:hypothetical protein